MRSVLNMLVRALVLSLICAQQVNAQVSAAAPPSKWDPTYWYETILSAQSARHRGEMLEAEGLCARAIPYAEAQAVKALRDHADLLDSQRPGSGADVRVKSERFAEIKAEQARATKPGSSFLGFVPWDEINAFADTLRAAKRESDSQSMRVLAASYRYIQEVYIHRNLLIRAGKDPRGEC